MDTIADIAVKPFSYEHLWQVQTSQVIETVQH